MEGNQQKMREALEDILEKIDRWRADGVMEHWQYIQLFDIADSALSSPPCNCDVGTTEEGVVEMKQTRMDLPYQYASIVVDPVSVSKFENDMFEFADEVRLRVHGEVAREYGLTKKQVEDSLNSACAEYERRYHIHPTNDPYRDLNELADLFTKRLEEMEKGGAE